MSKKLARVIDVSVPTDEGIPMILIDVHLLENSDSSSGERKRLLISPYDFKFPPGSDANEEISKLADAFSKHKGNVINIEYID